MNVDSRRIFLRAPLMLATLLTCASAHALPVLGSVADTGLASTASADRIVLRDHADPRIRYLPYDEIHLGKDQRTGRTAFRFQYTDDGGIVTALVSAGYSANARALRASLEAQGLDVRPLPASTGTWVLSAYSDDHRTVVGTPTTATILPEIPHALSIALNSEALQFLTKAFRTGASVGLNYVYSFRSAAEPRIIRARVNMLDLQTSLREQLERKASYCSWSSDATLTTSFCASTFEDVRSLVRTSIQQRQIRVVTIGEVSGEELLRQIDDLSRMVAAKLLRPIVVSGPGGVTQAPKPLPARCTIGVSEDHFDAACSSEETLFLYDAATRVQNREVTIEVSSQDLLVSQGAVGASFSYMCERHPETIVYVRSDGTAVNGCPTDFSPSGYATPASGGPALGAIAAALDLPEPVREGAPR